MASLQEVKDAIAVEKEEVLTAVGALNTKIQELQDQINQGGVVTAADLDEIKNGINGIFTA